MTHLNVRVQVVHDNLFLFFKHFPSTISRQLGQRTRILALITAANSEGSVESLRCSHAQRMDVDYGSNRNLEL